jgi:hypothetical protein
MHTTTVVVGLLLAFLLLFTTLGRITAGVLLGAALVGLAALYVNTHWAWVDPWLHQRFIDTPVGAVFGFAWMALIVGGASVGLYRWSKRIDRERRDQAARLIILRENAVRLWATKQPLDGEVLPPQRYLSP